MLQSPPMGESGSPEGEASPLTKEAPVTIEGPPLGPVALEELMLVALAPELVEANAVSEAPKDLGADPSFESIPDAPGSSWQLGGCRSVLL